jgi:eukaryotic-like serine/threonine-protein kinase
MKTFLIRLVLIILAFFAALIVLDRVVMPFFTSSGKHISVPDVRNMSFKEASRKLKWAGLEARKSYNVRYLPDVGPDIVIDQMPTPKADVKPGRNVYLVLNRQEKPSYPIPDLAGRSESEAKLVLSRIGMNVSDVQYQAVPSAEQDGRVLSQSVPPNVTVRIGSSVSIIVGKLEIEPEGMKRVVVPEVLGMSIDQARSAILQQGLKVGRITYEYSAILVPNTVISQKPAVNTMVAPGQMVDMTVVNQEGR